MCARGGVDATAHVWEGMHTSYRRASELHAAERALGVMAAFILERFNTGLKAGREG